MIWVSDFSATSHLALTFAASLLMSTPSVSKDVPPVSAAISLQMACTIDGEVVGCDPDGISDVDQDREVALHAFDLLEVNGIDTRRDVIEDRKRALAHLLRKIPDAIRFNPHFEREGKTVFELACKMGFAGIISKRRGSRYLSGRSTNWLLTRKFG